MMSAADFQFELPDGLIPSTPAESRGGRRDQARLAILNRGAGSVLHRRFTQLPGFLRHGDVLVVNDSLVVPDRLRGRTAAGSVTLVLYGHHVNGWHALVRPQDKAKPGLTIDIGDGLLRATLVQPSLDDLWLVCFEHEGPLPALLDRFGDRQAPGLRQFKRQMSLFRNVYAREPGSLEIPSAGLHFTDELLRQLARAGITVVAVTLHIGLTERNRYRQVPIRNIKNHRMPAEWFRVRRGAAAAINRARRQGARIFAVGTTVVRTLETAVDRNGGDGRIRPGEGWTDLFIYPGHRFKAVDAIVTNLHQPQSSHLLLVAAFAGKDLILEAYQEIVRRRYRFDLFGDSMLIV
jgi:S-adenosylmethionine:tRNA ribosyltransferase-isomerase